MTESTDVQRHLSSCQCASSNADSHPPAVQPTQLPAYDEETLVAACLRGEEVAWQRLLERYGRLIYTIARRFGFSQLVAEEIYQDVCLLIFEKLATLQDRRRLVNWLSTITRRACIKRLRMREQAVALDEGMALTSLAQVATNRFEEKILLVEQHEALRQAMTELEPRCQQLLQALFFDPLPAAYETIADRLAIPLGSVSPLRHRCLAKLRFKLLQLDPTLAARDTDPATESP